MDTASSQPSKAFIPITFMTGVYNEEARIRYVLEHAVRWADEVIVVNKSSTDRTKEICLEYEDRVKVIDVPYSPHGHDDVTACSKLPANDWIFFGTASEIPTRKLIEQVRETLNETNGELDLVYVPRKYYSFGIHDRRSPWYLNYAPFLVNRKKAIITNTVHRNFQPRDPQNTVTIEYSDECCVYHLTHTTAKDYMHAMTAYFEAEAIDCEDPVAKIRECMTNMFKHERQLRHGGDELLGHYFAWSIYWLGTALFVWEKMRDVDVNEQYTQLKQQVLQKEWLQENNSQVDGRSFTPPAILQNNDIPRFSIGNLDKLERQIITDQAVRTGFSAYAAGNLSDAGNHLVFAIRNDPSVLCKRSFWSPCLESIFGSRIMNYGRAWWRRLVQRNK